MLDTIDRTDTTDMLECSICFEIITKSSNANCSHHFCYDCLMKWCKSGGINCPMCRERMYQITQKDDMPTKDISDTEIPDKEKTTVIMIDLDSEKMDGIALSKEVNDKTTGLIIYDIHKSSIFVGYLNVGDRILFLNGLPCINLRHAIDVIDHTFDNRGILTVVIADDNSVVEHKKMLSDYNHAGCFGWLYKMLH
jgi:hypothetical protein